MRESLRRLADEESPGAGAGAGGMRRARIELLDGEFISIDIDRKARGSDLLDLVCESLDLREGDYFGLAHAHRGDARVWIDLRRRLAKTFKNEPWEVRFAVKFYPLEPAQLLEDLTRYQLALAVRQDLMEGRLPCSAVSCAVLASYTLQAELGDYAPPVSVATLADTRAAPQALLTEELVEHVCELYAQHKGQTPATAELSYLQTAVKLPLYGAERHAAADAAGAPIELAVGARGVAVLRDGLFLNRIPWAMITRVCYNSREFSLRLRAAEYEPVTALPSFRLPSARAAKALWRSAVEQHMFFRREAPVVVSRIAGFPRLGSRRLSCRRTLRQLRDADARSARNAREHA